MDITHIRNFSIIAHIDHGKSTLADRMLEITSKMKTTRAQILDSMELEREHGVTIKAHPVRMNYQTKSGQTYVLNLIDTPGHVDFSYEVSRSLAAVEGVVLLVDASQGVEAQTVAHTHLAISLKKYILPVINKIDLAHADLSGVSRQIEDILGIKHIRPLFVSAKEGVGVEEVLEAIVDTFPPPQGKVDGPLRALIFDSHFDQYHGAVIYVRVVDGEIVPGMKIRFISNNKTYEVSEVGIFSPSLKKQPRLGTGEIGYLMANIKNVLDIKMGDTITSPDTECEPLPGYKETKPIVFCGFYPIKATDHQTLKDSILKLHLNDPSWVYTPDTSPCLGPGFRCGFLGLFHMKIIQERLEREYNLELIMTNPTVPYLIKTKSQKIVEIENPTSLPPFHEIEEIREPYVKCIIILPEEYLGSIFKLCEERRGIQKDFKYLDGGRVILAYELPFSEIIRNFYDRLKSISHGYASMDYEHIGYRKADLVKLDILVAGNRVDALTCIVPKERAYGEARELALCLKELIPRQQFACPIQVSIGNRVIARETIPALRKDVTAKCYGGDVTRKKKLLEKQKEGKKRLKRIGKVDIPQEVFMAILNFRS